MSSIRYVVACAVLASSLAGALQGADAALRIIGAAGRDGVAQPELVLSLEQLHAMPHTSLRVKGHDGKERTYEGVLVSDLLNRTGQPLGATFGDRYLPDTP